MTTWHHGGWHLTWQETKNKRKIIKGPFGLEITQFSKLITPYSNLTFTQKLQNTLFGLITQLHISTTFCQNRRPHPLTLPSVATVATRVSLTKNLPPLLHPRPFCFLLFILFHILPNLATPKPDSATTNDKPRIHHHQPSFTTTNNKPRNPQPQPPPPTALNTTKKSEWIKNLNPPTALNQNHNLHQKIQANA